MKTVTLFSFTALLCLRVNIAWAQEQMTTDELLDFEIGYTMKEAETMYENAGLPIPEFISTEMCGGDTVAYLSAHGKPTDKYEWFAEDYRTGKLTKVGEGQNIRLHKDHFNKKIICKRNCDCYKINYYEKVIHAKRPLKLIVKEREWKKDRQVVTFKILGGEAPYFHEGKEVGKEFPLELLPGFDGDIDVWDANGCHDNRRVKHLDEKEKKRENEKKTGKVQRILASGDWFKNKRRVPKTSRFDFGYCFFNEKKGKKYKCPKL